MSEVRERVIVLLVMTTATFSPVSGKSQGNGFAEDRMASRAHVDAAAPLLPAKAVPNPPRPERPSVFAAAAFSRVTHENTTSY